MATRQHTPARLTIRRGAARTSISTSAGIDALAEVSFTGRQPNVEIGDDTVLISYPVVELPGLRARSAAVVLQAGRLWSVEIDGGAGYLDARLDAATVQSIVISGGAARSSLKLPHPVGVVPVTINGGVSIIELRLPAGTGYRLDIGGGVRNLVLDDQFLGTVGGPYHTRTPGLGDSDDHYRIAVGGGASRLSVTSSHARQRVSGVT